MGLLKNKEILGKKMERSLKGIGRIAPTKKQWELIENEELKLKNLPTQERYELNDKNEKVVTLQIQKGKARKSFKLTGDNAEELLQLFGDEYISLPMIVDYVAEIGKAPIMQSYEIAID